uniref:Chromatin assembly factor 1 subunit A n=1 Tax=Anthurium amnicola TaxID=1678845 RepID=A0A1D1XWI5_9ARAE
MADSKIVNVPPVETPSQPETGDGVDTVCSSLAHGLQQPGRDREEHEKVLKRSWKRRRVSGDMNVISTDKECLINAFRKEIDELFKFFNASLGWKLGSVDEKCCSINSAMACMLEGSSLSFSQLSNEIYEKLRAREMVTLASVQRDMQFISSRLNYGMDSGNQNFLEDESESCLWCWEVRDLKLLPKNKRKITKSVRKGREKVRERIASLSEILEVLMMPESQSTCMANFSKALEKLSKTPSLEEICSLVEKLTKKSDDEIAKMESKSKEKELLKEVEKNKRNIEMEMKKHDRELQKEKSQSKKELKLRQIEAEKEERRREKEQAEAKEKLSIQKQASLMERFLKSKKSNNIGTVDKLSEQPLVSDVSKKNFDIMGPTIASMDSAIFQQDSMNTEDLWKSHARSWHKMRCSNQYQHWGIRRKPKTNVISELKLHGSSCEAEASGNIKTPKKRNASGGMKGSTKSDFSRFADEIEEDTIHNQPCQSNDYIACKSILWSRRATKLLQYDKSFRPAYYGSWFKKSVVVGPRRPFAKDNDLDYDFDSDEEWEEEEPGESLSDCDKDDEEEILEGDSKVDEGDESEDSFFVPDGYLSENEGVQVDSVRTDCMSDEAGSSPRCTPNMENEEFFALLRQQKYVDNLTQLALRKNQPLIITNLLHEKSEITTGKDPFGASKVERICLHMLCMVACPGGPIIEPFDNQSSEDTDSRHTQSKKSIAPVVAATISDPNLQEYVCCIQSNPNAMAKVIESLHRKFPSVSKGQLRNKVREISEFVNNRWQVKKEVLDKLGISASPDKCRQLKGIATFFSSKRCLPPTGEVINLSESTPQSCPKAGALVTKDTHHVSRENLL